MWTEIKPESGSKNKQIFQTEIGGHRVELVLEHKGHWFVYCDDLKMKRSFVDAYAESNAKLAVQKMIDSKLQK